MEVERLGQRSRLGAGGTRVAEASAVYLFTPAPLACPYRRAQAREREEQRQLTSLALAVHPLSRRSRARKKTHGLITTALRTFSQNPVFVAWCANGFAESCSFRTTRLARNALCILRARTQLTER